MNNFQAASERFLAWFRSAGGEFRDDLIEIRDLRDQGKGRGIVAINDIPKDTILFTIPRAAILNVKTSDLSKKIPGIFEDVSGTGDEDDDSLDSWSALILVMLYEYLQGENSRWKPYFDVLPTAFDTPLFWSDAELQELEGTYLAPKRDKEQADKMLSSKVLPVVRKHPEVFYASGMTPLVDMDLLTLAHQMGSTIMAYAFDLEPEAEEQDTEGDGWVEDMEGKMMLGMVPMADILNANAAFNAHVTHEEQQLEIRSLRSTIPSGSEILNYYGPLPTSDLLRRYGYVTEEHHRYDIVELSWDLIRSHLRRRLKASEEVLSRADSSLRSKLESSAEAIEDSFILERDSGDPDEEGQLTEDAQFHALPTEMLDQLKAYLKIIKDSAPDIIQDKRKREDLIMNSIADALAARLGQYHSTIPEDEALLATEGISDRRRMAIHVRLGEKRLVVEAMSFIHGNQTQGSSSDDQSRKRTRI